MKNERSTAELFAETLDRTRQESSALADRCEAAQAIEERDEYRGHLEITREDPRTYGLLNKIPKSLRPALHRVYAEWYRKARVDGGYTDAAARNDALSFMRSDVARHLHDHAGRWAGAYLCDIIDHLCDEETRCAYRYHAN